MIDQNLQAHSAEAAIIAATMRNPAAADEVFWLRPEDFGHPLMREIWVAAQALRTEGRACDSMALHSEVQRVGKGGLFGSDPSARWGEIMRWAKMAEDDATLAERAREIREAAARRDLVARAERLAANARNQNTPLDELQEEAATIGTAAGGRLSISRSRDAADVLDEAFAHIMAVQRGEVPPGLSTHFPRLDAWTGGGIAKGDLWTVAAEPGGGKTDFGLTQIAWQAVNGKRVHVASAEMPADKIMTRVLSAASAIDSLPMRRKGGLNPRQLSTLGERAGQLAKRVRGLVTIDDQSNTTTDIGAEVRRIHAERPLDVVVIDHLHALRPPKGNNIDDCTSQMMFDIRQIALRICPVLLLAQYNRGVYTQTRPAMHNLKGSASIEQWSTIITLIHEPDQSARDGTTRKIELIVDKNREGVVGVLPFVYRPDVHRFLEAAEVQATEDSAPALPEEIDEGPEF